MLHALVASFALHFLGTGSGLAASNRRGTTLRLTEADEQSWPTPARSFAELQQAQVDEKEAAEAAALARPKPFVADDGSFSVPALTTVAVFVAGAAFFFSGISGGGIARFDDESPEVQACIQRASTRNEASACLPPVPLD